MTSALSSLWPWGSSPAPAPPKGKYDPTDPKQNPLNPQGLKPCCACPETKSKRDECFLKHDGDDADEACREVVQAHLACMRNLGFNL
ncbi:cytochrome C oxidase copper chaperone-domain-containing protein [Vararia minispora EC-137]|uniref:Cytochrome C oxidase copper chaperone-domain-containing protein n=1 Tax=Vararia minispora EC-137 TaxID=1314806 RepID=A0ACB8QT04_9AGAM|nr:cytochrome C oxidase copper chaperone-domain-containing protein [Vararia minispora EC-137]